MSEPEWITAFRQGGVFGVGLCQVPHNYVTCCFGLDEYCIILPVEALKDCYQPGESSDITVAEWVPKIDWSLGDLTTEEMVAEIYGTGAWTREELSGDEKRIRGIILWLAAGSYYDGCESEDGMNYVYV